MLLQYGFVRPTCGQPAAAALLPTPATVDLEAVIKVCDAAAAEVEVSFDARERWEA